jgi:DNA primase
MLISPEDGGQPYDRFRDRIIFPITDARGGSSFGGRAMDPDARAKYLNGPETRSSTRAATLYGLPEARKILHAAQCAESKGEQAGMVVVEGYMDVIACQRAGCRPWRPMGTALTEEQMEGCGACIRARPCASTATRPASAPPHRAIDRALPLLKPGRSFRFSMLVGGKDPDDVLREQGPAALKSAS